MKFSVFKMSTYSPAVPDSRLNERFSRKVQEERREEAQLEIFEEEEQHADLSSQKASKSENVTFRYQAIIN